jgi:hypothetical protein
MLLCVPLVWSKARFKNGQKIVPAFMKWAKDTSFQEWLLHAIFLGQCYFCDLFLFTEQIKWQQDAEGGKKLSQLLHRFKQVITSAAA